MERPFKLTRRSFLGAMFGALISSALPVISPAQRNFNLEVDASQVIGTCDPALWANIGYDPIYRLTVAPESQRVWEFIKQI